MAAAIDGSRLVDQLERLLKSLPKVSSRYFGRTRLRLAWVEMILGSGQNLAGAQRELEQAEKDIFLDETYTESNKLYASHHDCMIAIWQAINLGDLETAMNLLFSVTD